MKVLAFMATKEGLVLKWVTKRGSGLHGHESLGRASKQDVHLKAPRSIHPGEVFTTLPPKANTTQPMRLNPGSTLQNLVPAGVWASKLKRLKAHPTREFPDRCQTTLSPSLTFPSLINLSVQIL